MQKSQRCFVLQYGAAKLRVTKGELEKQMQEKSDQLEVSSSVFVYLRWCNFEGEKQVLIAIYF